MLADDVPPFAPPDVLLEDEDLDLDQDLDQDQDEYQEEARPWSPGSGVPLPQARTLLNTFTTFLTLTLHTLLYHRGIYPPRTFLIARHHNLPVPQSRHPAVCAWILDAVAQMQPLLAAGRLAKVSVNLHLPRTLDVAERWVFDVSHFPVWTDADEEEEMAGGVEGGGRADELGVDWEEDEDQRHGKAKMDDDEDGQIPQLDRVINWADVAEAVRGALSRIAHAAEIKGHLPKDSTFTLAIELRDDALAPVGHPQPWIPSDPSMQSGSRMKSKSRPPRGPASTVPLRTVEAGPLFFECWVEECPASRPKPPSQGGDSKRKSNVS